MALAERHAEKLDGLEEKFLNASVRRHARVAKEEVRKIRVGLTIIASLIIALFIALATIIGLLYSP